jgi:hypothetical protein
MQFSYPPVQQKNRKQLSAYFYAVLSGGKTEGNHAAFFVIGTFMAVWVTLYGLVQANTPRILQANERTEADLIDAAHTWNWGLATVPAMLTLAAVTATEQQIWLNLPLVIGLLIFGAVLALKSSLHSYLILTLTKAERVMMDVGYYYLANAGGRCWNHLAVGPNL